MNLGHEAQTPQPTRGCIGKIGYDSPKEAWEKQIRSEKKPARHFRRTWVKAEHRVVYRCDVCGLYHLGRPS